MKPRIKVDSSILIIIIIATTFLFLLRKLYVVTPLMDNVLDVYGLMLILKGNLLRMSARGHKKLNSQKSHSLVTTGPYSLVRNPMYLGSFTMGAGFVLIVWPWWSLPIFGYLFYLRFRIQVEKEERFLTDQFGEEYTQYCEKTPRAFPSIKKAWAMKTKDIYNLDEAFNTKEKLGVWLWPILAILLEFLQAKLVFGHVEVVATIVMFVVTFLAFGLLFGLFYKLR